MRSLLLALSLLLIAPAAAMAAPPPSDANLAQALFASGKDAMAKNDLATAEKRFTESLKLDPAVGTLLNLAACEEKLNKLALALTHFTLARSQLPKDDFRIAFTNEKIEALEKRVPKIVLKFPNGRPTKPRVLKDGQEIDPSTLDTPLLVDPGNHIIVYEAEKTELTLHEGDERTITLGELGVSKPPQPIISTLPPAKEQSPGSPAPANDDEKTKRTWAWVTAGVAGLGFATGAIAGLMTIDAASTYKDHCTDGECDPDGLDAASTGRTTRWVSPIGFGIGIAAGIASAWLFLSSRSSSPATARVVPAGNGIVVRF